MISPVLATKRVMKTCACGRSISRESWGKLRLLGTMDNGRGRGELLELRLCVCGSTLSSPVGDHSDSSSSPRLPVAEKV